jgi:ankyrin repeat protein
MAVIMICLFRQDGDTPLHKSAHRGRTEIMQLLIVGNANINARNEVSDESEGVLLAFGHRKI